ncbi:hypothetical protein SAMN03080601_02349 [Alkalitalea saponilacus]|uniref:Uncharacterized protein n=2 Tax=Alkalitalea saponilacus TaxID=889453 RepID=A0A1T5HIH0_9BACT|nr:hypothetical protein SAMN03080601_02349 [Alkalitalea saponilacus]
MISGMLMFLQSMNAINPDDNNNSDTVSITTSKHALYAGAGYGSDMLYSGYSLSGNQPFYSMDLLYSYNRKWSLAFVTYNLDGKSPVVTFYDVALGYRHIFNSWFDVRGSLASYFTAKSAQEEYFGNFSYLSVSTGYDWRILYTRAIYSTTLNRSGGSYFQIKNSHYFSTPDFWDGNAFMDFNPAFNFVFGDRYKLYTTTTRTVIPGVGNVEQTMEEIDTSFGLMDFELSFPISFNYGNATLEAEPLFYYPVHKDPDFPSQKGLFFFVNLYFRIL